MPLSAPAALLAAALEDDEIEVFEHVQDAARGELDLLPAGSAAQWEEDGDSAAMILRFPPSLLQRTAEELGLDGARCTFAIESDRVLQAGQAGAA